MRTMRHGFDNPAVKKSAITGVIALLATIGVVFSLKAADARDAPPPPNPTAYCDNPVVIPIASMLDGRAIAGSEVVMARGAEATVRDDRPVLRLGETGSRIQVSLAEPMFHTQWVFEQVDRNDLLRVDASASGGVRPLSSVSTFGSFDPATGANESAWTAIGTGDGGAAQVDLHSGAEALLFSNNGSSAIELVGAIGCPALVIDQAVRTPPTWDAETQRFVARYSVTLKNNLPDRSSLEVITGRRDDGQDLPRSATEIDDILVDLDVQSPGFGSATITDWDAPSLFAAFADPTFDGVNQTRLFTRPRSIVTRVPQTLTFEVAYEADFTDPVWESGVGVPTPRFGVESTVDGIVQTQLIRLGATSESDSDSDSSLQQQGFAPPIPALTVSHRAAQAPRNRPDGTVAISELVTLTNTGETDLDEVSAEYDLSAMYGPGTQVSAVTAIGTDACSGRTNRTYDGGVTNSVLVVVDQPLPVGATCAVAIRASVLPGIVPSRFGSTYQTSLIAQGSSGVLEVTGRTSIDSTLRQTAELSGDFSEIEVANQRDGTYVLRGDLVVGNTGDQDIANVVLTVDVESDNAAGELVPRPVRVEALSASGTGCVSAGLPDRATTGFFGFADSVASLAPGGECRVSFAVRATPAADLSDWRFVSSISGDSSRSQLVSNNEKSTPVDLPEASAIEVETSATSPVNNGDGTYTFQVAHAIRNSGDVPLGSILVSDSLRSADASRVATFDLLESSCANVSPETPLPADGETTCVERSLVVLRPGSTVRNWTVEGDVTAMSLSGAETAATSTSNELSFDSAPSVEVLFVLDEVAKAGDESFQFVFDGTITNTGDIVLAGVNAELDLERAFGDLPYRIDFLSSRDLTVSNAFDGGETRQLLTGTDSMVVGAQRSFRMSVTVESADQPGPFDFAFRAWGVAPSRSVVSDRIEPISELVPIVGIVNRQLSQVNNSDGTYEVTHTVLVENLGGTPLPSTSVSTDFGAQFGWISVGEKIVVDACVGATLEIGAVCSVRTTATTRPGEFVGPYSVTSVLAAVSPAGVEAVVLPETLARPVDATVHLPLTFVEEPGMAVTVDVSDAINNSDGTYTLDYTVTVTNEGDVPFYDVAVSNGVFETFTDRLIADLIPGDSCSLVGFGEPLAVGASCAIHHQSTIRPADILGPWRAEFDVVATSPASDTVERTVAAPIVQFEESVTASTDVVLDLTSNNGDGTYNVLVGVTVDNTGDVPLIAAEVDPGFGVFGSRLEGSNLVFDSCRDVSSRQPLLPLTGCEVQADLLVRPIAELGPWTTVAGSIGASASGETATSQATSAPLTLPEAPSLLLESFVRSVENNGDGSFRVVTDIAVTNDGDVRVDDLQLDVDLADAFGAAGFQIEAVFSRSFEVSDTFRSGTSTDLLGSGLSLSPGVSGTATVIVRVVPGSEVGPFSTEMMASAAAPSTAKVQQVELLTVDLPAIAVRVREQSTINNRDGSYVVETIYEVENRGTTRLENLRVLEDLVEIYPAASARLDSVTSDLLAVLDPSQRSRSNDLLVPGASLDVAATAQITTHVNVIPGNALGPFLAEVLVVAASPTGTEVALRTAGGSGVVFVESPDLRVSQRLVRRPVWNPDGRFDVTFAIDIVNDGDIELRQVQIREDLLQALGSNSSVIVRDVRSETLTPNPGFDGLGIPPVDPTTSDADSEADTERPRDLGDTRILSGGDVLPAGTSGTVEVDLTLTPADRGVFSTRVVASAISPGGADLGSETPIEASTLTRLTVQGELGVAKQVVGEPIVRSDGSVAVTYEIFVENVGPFPLDDVEIHDQLNQAFGIGSSFVTSRVRTESDSPCMGQVSATYDGGTIDPVLVTGVMLRPAESCRVQYDAVVKPQKDFPGPFRSSAFAIASDPFGGAVIDDSTDGANPDPDGNEEPGDNDVATSFQIAAPAPDLEVSVESTGVVSNGESFDLTFEFTLTNVGPIDVTAPRVAIDLQNQWDNDFTIRSIESSDLTVNDDFDGDREIRLVAQQNQLSAGSTAVITLIVAADVDPREVLDLEVTFDAVSAAGGSTSVLGSTATASTSVAMDATNGGGSWFGDMSTDEQRMLLLGLAAFAVIAVALASGAVQKWRSRRDLRSFVEPDPPIDLRSRPSTVDLRSRGSRHLRRSDGHNRRRRRVPSAHRDEASDDEIPTN